MQSIVYFLSLIFICSKINVFSEYKKYPIDFYYKTDNFIDKDYIRNECTAWCWEIYLSGE